MPVLSILPNPLKEGSKQKTSCVTKEHTSTASFYCPNETVLNRKKTTEFCLLLSNLLFWLCCLKVRWSQKSSLHTGHHLALCQMLTSREMQFILLTLTEKKKNPQNNPQTCKNLYALFCSLFLTGKSAFVLQCYFITLISNSNDCWKLTKFNTNPE